MNQQSYLIDTNILIGLEDNHTVEASYSKFHALASAHKVDIYVHEASKDDNARDKDVGQSHSARLQSTVLLKNSAGYLRLT